MKDFLRVHWVSTVALGASVLYSLTGADIQATVCAIGMLILVELEDLQERL